MKKYFGLAMLALSMSMNLSAQVSIELNPAERGATINPRHYGIFYEEINHAGDGGLYAELIRNRSIEDNAGNPDFWWTEGNSVLSVSNEFPLNSNSPKCMKVQMNASNTGARNEGWWGVNIVNGRQYHLTMWVNGGNATYNGNITVRLQNASGGNMGQAVINGPFEPGWKKVEATITATGNDPVGWFAMVGSTAGTLYYDCVSLFPPTYKGRENGCRIDLAEKLEALHPAFMRFPGGCYIEGAWTAAHPAQNRFEWKKTIGPIENRPGHFNNNWGYACSDGFGFHECLQLCEDLGAEPMFVVNMGFGHDWEDDISNINVYIQEALDAIEYCNGDLTTKWGQERAKNGHPEPFNLRLIEIGNENYFFGSYSPRYKLFYEAIHSKYPEVLCIANGWYSYGNPWPADFVDDHYYNSPEYFVGKYRLFDNHNRADYKLYIGEYAVTDNFGWVGNMNAALGEAVFMQGMENNSDVVLMNSYAPIFAHENNVLWRPDMIRYNSSSSFGTPSYYVQQLMANYHGTENVKWTEIDNGKPAYSIALSSWGTSVKYDNIKVRNASNKVVYKNDFSSDDLSDWTFDGGTWSVVDGMLQQTKTNMYGNLAILNGQDFGTTYTIELDAVKVSGDEGFLIGFNVQDNKNYCWFNIGGWGNSQHAIEQALNGSRRTLGTKSGQLTNGTTYKIKIEVQNGFAKAYINNELQVEKSYMPNEQKLYLASNIDDESGKLYIKVVNPYDEAQRTTFTLKKGSFTGGVLHVLKSENGTDENNINQPGNVLPKDLSVKPQGNTLTYLVPKYSLCIFEMDVDDAEAIINQMEVPEPLVSYSFEPTDKTSDLINGKNYSYNTIGDGTFVVEDDGNRCYYSNTSGYLSLGKQMPQEVLQQLTGDYTVSLRLKMDGIGNADSFCWAWALADGTSNYIGFINSPNNNNWYFEYNRNSAGTRLDTNSGLMFGGWHEITVTCKEGTTSIYLDGFLTSTSKSFTNAPSAIATSVSASYIAKSPFGGDKIMTKTYFDDFKIYNVALDAEQVKAINEGNAEIVPTAIESVEQEREVNNGQTYDLNGRPVSNQQEGLIIVNGKVILNK